MGIAYESLGNYGKAIEYQEQSLAIARDIKDRPGEGRSLGNLGTIHHALGNYSKAIEYYEQSLAIAQQIKDIQSKGAVLNGLGITYRALSYYSKAIKYHEQSLTIAQQIKDRRGEGKVLGSLGLDYFSLGNYTKAIEYHEQSLTIAQQIKNRLGEGQCLGNLGVVYLALGNYNKAVEYLEQYLAIARQVKNLKSQGAALGNLGSAYRVLGNYAKAVGYLEQHLAITRQIKDRLGEGQALNNLGTAYFYSGNYRKAIEYQEKSLAIARQIKDHLGEGNALNNLGVVIFKSGDLTKAIKVLMNGISTWEFLRQTGVGNNDANKVSIFEQQANTYRTLQEVFIAQNRPNAALEIAERGRARAFVELLTQRLGTKVEGDPLNLVQIQQIGRAQNAVLVQYSIIYDDFKVQGKLESREAELYIWVVQPTGEITFHKVDLKPLWQKHNSSLEELVRSGREAIGVETIAARNLGNGTIDLKLSEKEQERRQAERKRALQQLYQLLIQPIEAELPKNPDDRVVFIPQGDLFLVPFPALMDAKGNYLLEKHTLQISPSIQVLGLTQQLKSTPRSANGTVVVGNPVMPYVWNPDTGKEVQLPDLQGAQQEAIAIAQQLKTQPLLWDKATKAAVIQQMQSARLIHLATHGLLDYGNPQELGVLDVPGAIALAPAGKDNGLLTSAEIADLKLNADLVVLSACDTGRGRLTSDGVIGLSRSFITAGVPSVMVSLWAVNDAATAELMQEFYRLWQNPTQRLNKAQALRQAMLTTMKKHPDPRLWAAFTLVGQAE